MAQSLRASGSEISQVWNPLLNLLFLLIRITW